MGRKPGFKSTIWNKGRNKLNIQPEQNEETKFKKMRLRNLWDNFKCSNIHIIGVPEAEEEEQETENYFENIVKKNFPDLVKELDMQGHSESSKEVGPKEAHTKAHWNYITQD